MRTSLLFLAIFSVTQISAQIYERTDDRGFRTTTERVSALEDGSWIALTRYGSFNTFPILESTIQRFEADGNLLWEASSFWHQPKEIIVLDDLNIAAFSSFDGCDVGIGYPMQAQLLSIEGDVLLDKSIECNVDAFNSDIQGCFLDSIVVLSTGHDNSSGVSPTQLIGLNTDLDSLWNLLLDYAEISLLTRQGDLAVVLAENELLRADVFGNKVDSLQLSEMPLHVTSIAGNSLLLCMPDGLYQLDYFLNLDLVMNYPESETPQEMLWENDQIHLIYPGTIYVYDGTYTLVNEVNYNPLPQFELRDADLFEDKYLLGGNRPFITSFRYSTFTSDFATSSGAMQIIPAQQIVPPQSPDAALRHLELSNYNPEPSNISWEHAVDATFYLINEGDVPLDSVQINFASNGNPITCAIHGLVKEFVELNLTPGDSVMLSWEQIHYDQSYFSIPVDTLVEYCLYVTRPNSLYDRVKGNDEVCASVITVSLKDRGIGNVSLYPNPATDILFIESKNALVSSIEIFSVIGQVIHRRSNLQESITRVDISGWPRGSYVAHLNLKNGERRTIQFVIAH